MAHGLIPRSRLSIVEVAAIAVLILSAVGFLRFDYFGLIYFKFLAALAVNTRGFNRNHSGTWPLNQVGRGRISSQAVGRVGVADRSPLGGPTLVHSIKFVPLIETARTIGLEPRRPRSAGSSSGRQGSPVISCPYPNGGPLSLGHQSDPTAEPAVIHLWRDRSALPLHNGTAGPCDAGTMAAASAFSWDVPGVWRWR